MTFDLSLYNEDFFAWHLEHARAYSIKTMDWYIDTYQPSDVVDFGCGIGSYLESAYKKSRKVLGFDISPYAKDFTPYYLHPFITYMDCTRPINCGPFDCVISFETAEHIDPSGTTQFVLNLVNATGKHLLFTAAPPGQEGTGHINLHPKQYWINIFAKYLTFDVPATVKISDKWRELGAPNYICDNLIVFKI
jgi:2-polyprenyl-3-methyl-5-hydroxy-6-metoxy-1,4-benzoquinol methylase